MSYYNVVCEDSVTNAHVCVYVYMLYMMLVLGLLLKGVYVTGNVENPDIVIQW